ncbi:hypothetical protein PS627_00105 [Pseudomonas fluorescens]|nr:hypothetical protein PS627_00105 [Pseudomonas fluorescens]
MLPLTLLPGYSGAVISFRQLSRSSISPCEQVGEHHGGAGGCLASGDSGGIRGGATDGGGEGCGVVLQPLASSIGASSASISNRSFFLGMGSRLLLRLGASLFFLPGAAFTQRFRQPLATVALGRCSQGFGSLDRPAVLVCATVGGQHQRQQAETQRPAHASARRTPSSITSALYGLPPFSWMMMLSTMPRRVAGSLMLIGSVGFTPRRLATAAA